LSLPMVLALVFPVWARAFFSFLRLTGTSGSQKRRAPRVALFAPAFFLLPLSLAILGLICLPFLRLGPPFLRLRPRAFLRLSLSVLRLAFFGLLRPIVNLASFVLTLVLLGLNGPILRLMPLGWRRLN